MRTLRHTVFTALLVFTGHAAAQTLTTLATFTSAPSDGIDPSGVAIGAGGVLYGVAARGGALGWGTVFSLTPPASPGGPWTEAVLYNFTGGGDGGSPTGVVIGGGGVLYGATSYGGTGTAGCDGGCGSVFALTPPASPGAAWTESVLYSFRSGTDGSAPTSGVVIGNGGVLYGTTSNGGTGNSGTVFSLTPPKGAPSGAGGAWTEAVLYSFAGGFNQSLGPTSVVIGASGVLYGATRTGGTGTGLICSGLGCGTVFSLTPPKAGSGGAWTQAVLYSFGGGLSGVAIGNGGVLYGTTAGTISNTVFSLTPPASPATGNWTETVLYTFGAGGAGDVAGSSGVVVGNGGILYGTASGGGASKLGGVFSLTPPAGSGGAWTETVLYSFMGGNDGSQPFAGVVIGSGGVLYGATATGGPAYAGTVFSLTPPQSASGAWTESVLHAFTGGSPGIGVLSGVVVGNGGVLYGTTEGGGTGSCPTGCGTVFSLTPPASEPFGSGTWTANVLYRFTGGSDGAYPIAGVAVGNNGVLYGPRSTAGPGRARRGRSRLQAQAAESCFP